MNFNFLCISRNRYLQNVILIDCIQIKQNIYLTFKRINRKFFTNL